MHFIPRDTFLLFKNVKFNWIAFPNLSLLCIKMFILHSLLHLCILMNSIHLTIYSLKFYL